jgi:hypothetical protein
MQLVVALLALLAAPFWETKAPGDWSEGQIELLLHDSPWAQMAGPVPEVQIYLATAEPIRAAEAEIARRRAKALHADYLDYLRQERAHSIVLAISYKDATPLADAAEARRMEEESIMRIGRQKYQITGHFPPVPSDPFLRLVYPRAVTARDTTVTFELYLPGRGPYHEADFRVREMLYQGKLEM